MAKQGNKPVGEMSFLDHLEELRWHLIRSVVVIFGLAIFFFIQRDFLFDVVILAPKHSDFFTYRMMCKLSYFLEMGDSLCIKDMEFNLINTTLSGQFTMHMWAAFIAGLVVGFPYLVWEAWRFIKPALTSVEIGYSRSLIFFVSILFSIGVLFGYFLIAPLSINFLGSYQVSTSVQNMIEMDSYISTITIITLASGIIFELPIVVYFLSKLGILTPTFMRRYRKHAVVVILILAAVITPSPDITSQLLVALPVYVLYEASIFVSAYVLNKKNKET